MLWMLSPAMPVFALLAIAAAGFTDAGWAFWAMPVFFYGVIPLLDYLIGEDENNHPESAVNALEADDYYRIIAKLFWIPQYAATVLGAWLAVKGNLAVWELAGLIGTMGVVQGLGINTAHELGHKRGSVERCLAKLILAPSLYGHFFIEHNKGHHKNVATPEDPASSRMGESLYAFLPRTMIGSLKSAWNIEAARLKRLEKPILSLSNENLQAWGITVVLFAGLALWLGVAVLPYLIVSGLMGAALLEIVNYLEHYGLLRQKEANGRYERCAPRHSWNSNHIVSNLLVYQLQRHSDHHAHPTRSYQALRHFDDSPQLPAGYAAMIVLALFPPLWYRVMDRKVAEHWGYDMNLAHLAASQRERLMVRWHKQDGSRAHVVDTQTQAGAVLEADAATTCYECPDCGHIYNERVGEPTEGYPAGTRWSQIPDDWACTNCAVRDKVDFRPMVSGPDSLVTKAE
ncbi:MAG: fatty acid desaturase [Nevskiales bacterium]